MSEDAWLVGYLDRWMDGWLEVWMHSSQLVIAKTCQINWKPLNIVPTEMIWKKIVVIETTTKISSTEIEGKQADSK